MSPFVRMGVIITLLAAEAKNFLSKKSPGQFYICTTCKQLMNEMFDWIKWFIIWLQIMFFSDWLTSLVTFFDISLYSPHARWIQHLFTWRHITCSEYYTIIVFGIGCYLDLSTWKNVIFTEPQARWIYVYKGG